MHHKADGVVTAYWFVVKVSVPVYRFDSGNHGVYDLCNFDVGCIIRLYDN